MAVEKKPDAPIVTQAPVVKAEEDSPAKPKKERKEKKPKSDVVYVDALAELMSRVQVKGMFFLIPSFHAYLSKLQKSQSTRLPTHLLQSRPRHRRNRHRLLLMMVEPLEGNC